MAFSAILVVAICLSSFSIFFVFYQAFALLKEDNPWLMQSVRNMQSQPFRLKSYNKMFCFLLFFTGLIQIAAIYCASATISLPSDSLDPANDYLTMRLIVVYINIPGLGTFMFQALSILAIVELLRLFAVLDDRITPHRLQLLQIFALFSAIVMNSPLAAVIGLVWTSITALQENIGYAAFFLFPLISLFVSAGVENALLWFIGKLVSKKACEVGRHVEFQELQLQFQKFNRSIATSTIIGVTFLGLGALQFHFYNAFDFAYLSFSLISLKVAAQIWIFQQCRKVALLKRPRKGSQSWKTPGPEIELVGTQKHELVSLMATEKIGSIFSG
jgi:hypothetical protein